MLEKHRQVAQAYSFISDEQSTRVNPSVELLSARPEAASVSLRRGTVLDGRFTVECKLGSDGFGVT